MNDVMQWSWVIEHIMLHFVFPIRVASIVMILSGLRRLIPIDDLGIFRLINIWQKSHFEDIFSSIWPLSRSFLAS